MGEEWEPGGGRYVIFLGLSVYSSMDLLDLGGLHARPWKRGLGELDRTRDPEVRCLARAKDSLDPYDLAWYLKRLRVNSL